MTVRRTPLSKVAIAHIGIETAPRAALHEVRELRRAGQWEQVRQKLGDLFEIYPNDPAVWHEMARLYLATGDKARALTTLRSVWEAGTTHPDVPFQIGLLLDHRGEYEEALPWFDRATRLARKHGVPYPLAVVGALQAHAKLGRRMAAHEGVRRVRAIAKTDGVSLGDLPPVHLDAPSKFACAQILLATGDWELGWKMHEARLEMFEHQGGYQRHERGLPEYARLLPEWDGKQKVQVLVTAEQGYGDVIMFARYLPWVATLTGAKVVATVQSRLVPLLRDRLDLRVRIEDEDDPNASVLEGCESRARLMSLPHLLGMPTPIGPWGLQGYQWSGPRRAFARAEGDPYRVGIVWKGESAFGGDKDRSTSCAMIEGALMAGVVDEYDDRPVELVSLQYGEGLLKGQSLHNPKDWSETADLIMRCDAVVAVNTSTFHLAGTMGVPTVLLPFTSYDWRTPETNKVTSPWYPSVRLVRRKRSEDWAEVMPEVVSEVRKMLWTESR